MNLHEIRLECLRMAERLVGANDSKEICRVAQELFEFAENGERFDIFEQEDDKRKTA